MRLYATIRLHIDFRYEGAHMESPHTEVDQLDRIERSIDIDAPAERVWALISRPGWWINDGTIDPDPDVYHDDDVTTLIHPNYGRFQLRTVSTDPPSYIAFRWLDQDSSPLGEQGTLIEFWVHQGSRGVTLTVVESGFTKLGKQPTDVVQQVQENTEGWRVEFIAAQTFLEAPTT